MSEIVLFVLVLAIGFGLELAVHTFLINRHLKGKPTWAWLDRFYSNIEGNITSILTYMVFRLNKVRYGK